MASPASGPGRPIVDRFGGNRGRLGEMVPLPVKGKKPKGPKLTIQPVPAPGQYSSIKKSKFVNKVYKTY